MSFVLLLGTALKKKTCLIIVSMSAVNVISCMLRYDFSVNIARDIDQTLAAWKLGAWEYPSNTSKC
jgi:hypothetical protein